MLDIRPISPAIGAEIIGIDLSRPLNDTTVGHIRRALLDHLVVFFRDQSLSPSRLLDIARHFGPLSQYPFVRGLDEYPDVVEVIKNKDETVNFGGLWHSDTSYLPCPPLGSLLYAIEVPETGGDTLFANMYLAYESLSEGMKDLLSGLIATNSADKADAAITRVDRKADRPKESSDVVTIANHPVVRTHPETGRKALYVSRAHTVNIDGFTNEESEAVLAHLYRTQARPQFSCRFQWTPGALAFWDNRAAQHNAINDYHGHRRVMQRVTLAGDRPF